MKMHRFSALYFLLMFCWAVSAAAGRNGQLSDGRWELKYSEKNGVIESVNYGGIPVSSGIARNLSTEKGKISSFTLKQAKYDKKKRELRLTLERNGWQLTEIISLDCHKTPGLMRFDYELIRNPRETEQKFYSIELSALFPEESRYFIPCSVGGDLRSFQEVINFPDPEKYRRLSLHRGIVKELKQSVSGECSSGFLLESPGRTTIGIFRDDRRDKIKTNLHHTADNARVTQLIESAGWGLPGGLQHIGSCYFWVRPDETLEAFFDRSFNRWFTLIGATVPKDRPAWVTNASVYEVNSRYGVEKEKFAFFTKLASHIASIGFNTIYMQPIQAGHQWYIPHDYFKIAPIIGTPEEYKAFVDAVHEKKLRILQDIVPHGGPPYVVRYRGQSAVWSAIGPTGDHHSPNPRYVMDFMSPGWLDHMYRAGSFLMDFGIDGFRIDQPYGSGYNWRKRGFPSAETPVKYMDRKWLLESIAREKNHEMPPLEYERASLPHRQGGFEMIRNLRRSVKDKRADGAVLSEVLDNMISSTSDMTYDLFFYKLTGIWEKSSPGDFVEILKRYLYEQEKASPPGTLFLRVFQNHDTDSRFGKLGAGAGRAAFAVCALTYGVPILFQNNDIGHGIFLKRLLEIRQSRPEYASGSSGFFAVKCSAPEVWTILRYTNSQASIGVVNFAPRPIDGIFTLPLKEMKLREEENYRIDDLLSQRVVAVGTGKNLKRISCRLQPYETMILAATPAGKQAVAEKSVSPSSAPEKTLSIREENDRICVVGSSYSLDIDRETGFPIFRNAAGQVLIRKPDLLFNAPAASVAPPEVSRSGDSVAVKYLFPAASVELNYRFLPDAVHVSAKYSGERRGQYGMLLLPFAEEKGAWRVSTLEGSLHDRFRAGLNSWKYSALSEVVEYRDPLRNILYWDHEAQPLDPSDPVVGLFPEQGDGLELRITDPLRAAPANLLLYQGAGSENHPALGLCFFAPGPLAADAPMEFSFTLSTAGENERQEHFPRPVKVGGVTLSGESSSYRIANSHYRLRLSRSGGVIRDLKVKGSPLFSQTLGAKKLPGCSGIGRNTEDTDTSVRIWAEGEVLKMRFLSLFRGGKSRWNRASIRVWNVTEYAFSEKDCFESSIHVMCDQYIAPGKLSLEYEVNFDEDVTAQIQKEQLTLKRNGSVFSFSTGQGGKGTWRKEPLKAVFPLLKETDSLPPRLWRSFRFCCRAGNSGVTPAPTASVGFLSRNRYVPDGSFNSFGGAFSVREGKRIPHRLHSSWPGFWNISFCDAGFDPADAAAVALHFWGGHALSAGHYYYPASTVFPMPEKRLSPGRYLWRTKIRSRGISPGSSFEITLQGVDGNGKPKVVTQRKTLSSSVPERTEFTIPFSLKEEFFPYSIRLNLMDYGSGEVWIYGSDVAEVK